MSDKFWDYRILKRTYSTGEIGYGIYEVFYNGKGKPIMCTEDPCGAYGDTIEELQQDFTPHISILDITVVEKRLINGSCKGISISISGQRGLIMKWGN
jgi:hypothetical protein